MAKLVSVILPTLHREPFLLAALNDLLVQDYASFEVLVVDQSDQPSVSVQKLAAAHPGRIHYHHVRFRGLPLARNFAWQKAKGDILLYLDDDSRCPPQLVSEHMRSMEDQTVGVVAGGVDEANRPEEKNPRVTGTFSYWTATPKRGFQSHNPQDVQHVPGGNFSVRRKLIPEVGGFDEWLNQGAALYEETDFCLRVVRAGHRIVFNPKARIVHLAAATGGCREPDLDRYLHSMSRNRTMIIRRYLKWYQRPLALVRLLLLNLSYVRSRRDPKALVSGLAGFKEGFSSHLQPVVTSYD